MSTVALPGSTRRRAAARAPALPAQERARRRAVRLVFALLLLAFLEGVLRKWVMPQVGSYIFFLRDPVLLWLYVHAWRHHLWPRRSAALNVSWVMAGIGALLLLLQAATGGESDHRWLLGAYGWRAYFLYTPMAFLVGALFRRDDLLRLARVLLVLAVPVAVLVAAQFAASPGAPINVGIAEEKELQFHGITLNAERTRPTGPFASVAGQQQYVAASIAMLLAFFVSPRRLSQPGLPLLLAGAAGLLSCLALSGSRGMVLQCALSVLAAAAVGLVARGGGVKGRAFLWPVLITGAALLAYPLLFPEGYSAFVERWQGAAIAESKTFEQSGVFGRALYGLVDFAGVIDHVPLLGLGLGFGGNAATTLKARIDGVPVAGLAETDFSRHMVDLGPLFGIGYIVFRLALAVWLTRLALRATRGQGDPLPLLLWSYTAYVVVMGQITGQGTINFFGWLFTGLLIAACRPLSAPVPAPVAVSAAAPRRAFPRPVRTLPRRRT